MPRDYQKLKYAAVVAELGPVFALCGLLLPAFTFIYASSSLLKQACQSHDRRLMRPAKTFLRTSFIIVLVERSFPLYTPAYIKISTRNENEC